MTAKLLNIEIGERLIKICGTIPGKASIKVVNSLMIQTPQNAVIDGEIINPEAVAAVIKDNLAKHGIKTKKVTFTLVSGRIATREVTTPPVKDNRIKAIVEAGASDYFPVDMSKYHITYSLIERKTSGDDAGCKLIVMAAPLAVLEGYFKVANLAGFQVAAVDYSGNSQFRLLESIPANEVTMYIDVDCTFSITTVMRQGKLLMQRTFNSGVDDLVAAYMNVTRKGDNEYIAALNELSSMRVSNDNPGILPIHDVNEYLSRLVSNITRIVDYFNSTSWETPIEKLVLTGCGASVLGLREAVAESTGMPVEIISKMDTVSAPQTLTGNLPKYMTCIGSAFFPVEFIPEQFSKTKKKETKKKSKSLTTGIMVLIIGIVAAAGISAASILEYNNNLSEKNNLQNSIKQLEPAENIHKAYTAYLKYNDDVQALDKNLKTPNDELLSFISELEQKMPTDVIIVSAVCTENDISMNLSTNSKEAAAKTIVQLRSFKSISNIQVGEVKEATNNQGLLEVTFSVKCSYADAVKNTNNKQTGSSAANAGSDNSRNSTVSPSPSAAPETTPNSAESTGTGAASNTNTSAASTESPSSSPSSGQ